MTENILNTLEIHQLTKAQYNAAKADGKLNENALYLTPSETCVSRIGGFILSDATNWSDNIYTGLNSEYPADEYDIDVELSSSATEAQTEAWEDAEFCGSLDDNRLVAKGVKPEFNLPIVITLYKK